MINREYYFDELWPENPLPSPQGKIIYLDYVYPNFNIIEIEKNIIERLNGKLD